MRYSLLVKVKRTPLQAQSLFFSFLDTATMSAVQLVLSLAAFGTLSEASPCRKSRCPCDRPFHEAVQPRGVRRMPLRACRISAKLHSVPAFLLTNANCIELARMVNFADSSTTLFNDFQHLTLTSQRPWRFFFYSSAEIQTSSITCQLRSTRPVSCDLGENVADLASSWSLATGCHGSKEIVGLEALRWSTNCRKQKPRP